MILDHFIFEFAINVRQATETLVQKYVQAAICEKKLCGCWSVCVCEMCTCKEKIQKKMKRKQRTAGCKKGVSKDFVVDMPL